MKKYITLFILTALALPVWAQAPAAPAAAEQKERAALGKLVDLPFVVETLNFERVEDITTKRVNAVFQSVNVPQAEREKYIAAAKLNNAEKEAVEKFMVDEMVKAFTQEEIDALLAFYSSPLGKKIGEKLPDIITKTKETMFKTASEKADKVQKSLLTQ